jgi:hypothetical protein
MVMKLQPSASSRHQLGQTRSRSSQSDQPRELPFSNSIFSSTTKYHRDRTSSSEQITTHTTLQRVARPRTHAVAHQPDSQRVVPLPWQTRPSPRICAVSVSKFTLFRVSYPIQVRPR